MKDFLSRLARIRIPYAAAAEETISTLGPGGRALFLSLSGALVFSTVGLLFMLESSVVVPTPARGGELTEGTVGSPRFINPILAISDADRDLSQLVYGGLLKPTPGGEYLHDLASSYDISEDGTTYTFYVRPDATFHDGVAVTAEDVVFTIRKAQNPTLKSPLRANWEGVVVEALDAHTVRFTLKGPYAPFIENLSLGILPKHLWQGVSDDEFPFSNLNTSPVGSGPYRVGGIARSTGGIPSSYTLKAFAQYPLGEPYLSTLVVRFYQSEQALISALTSGEVEAASGISPAHLAEVSNTKVVTAPLNRVFGVFFNQNQSEVLRDKDVRTALNDSVDRTTLVAEVLGGYGTPLFGPVPPSILVGLGVSKQDVLSAASSTDLALTAQARLIARGWKLGDDGVLAKTTGTGSSAKTTRLTFKLSTGNVPELRAAAQYVEEQWRKMGAQVEVEIFEQGDLSQNVIRPRKYDALLFGEVIGRELDLFAFWHSRERNDPGLNIALYANAAADKALSDLRETHSDTERLAAYQAFAAELVRDIPAVFLYAPDFVYTVRNDLEGLNLGLIETPSDRFLSVNNWHRETDRVWPIFVRH